MPDVKPMPSAGAIRRSVNGADQKGVGSGRATVTEIIAGHYLRYHRGDHVQALHRWESQRINSGMYPFILIEAVD